MMQALPQTYADFERAVTLDARRSADHERPVALPDRSWPRSSGCDGPRRCSRRISFLSAYDETILPPVPWLWRLQALGPRIYGAILRAGQARSAKPDEARSPTSGGRSACRRSPIPSSTTSTRRTSSLRCSRGCSACRDPTGRHRPSSRALRSTTDRSRSSRPTWRPSSSRDHGRSCSRSGSAAVFDPGRFFEESVTRGGARRPPGRVARGSVRRAACAAESRRRRLRLRAVLQAVSTRRTSIVHQGGSGTTGQAMRAGRPMVIVPYGTISRTTRCG